MKLTSFWEAVLGDKPKGYIPLDGSLNFAIADNVRMNLQEMSPGYLLRLHFEPGQRRWWLIIERVGLSRGVLHG